MPSKSVRPSSFVPRSFFILLSSLLPALISLVLLLPTALAQE